MGLENIFGGLSPESWHLDESNIKAEVMQLKLYHAKELIRQLKCKLYIEASGAEQLRKKW